MIDIHCHILWDTDDGAASLKEAQNMCQVSASQGVKAICATPHYILQERELDRDTIEKKIEILNEYCEKNSLDLKIVSGCECYINPIIYKYIDENKLITINNSKYMLIEFPMGELPYYTSETIYKILLKGINPIIAHPERYSFVRKNPNIICELIEKGCFMQINAGSLLGYFGSEVKSMAFSLLKHNMVHLIGSDAHSSIADERGICMSQAYEAINSFSNKIISVKDLHNNALSVIQNKEIKYTEPIKYDLKTKGSSKYAQKNTVWYKLSKIFLS